MARKMKGGNRLALTVLFLVVAVGITLGVLGGMGYLSKKGGSSRPPNMPYTPGSPGGGETTCIPPDVRAVSLDPSSGSLTVYFNIATQECLNYSKGPAGQESVSYWVQNYDSNGMPFGGVISSEAVTAGDNKIIIPTSGWAPGGIHNPSTADIYIGYRTWDSTGSLKSKVYKFTY